MAIPRVTYKRSGPTTEQINEVMVDKFVFAVLHDQESTPDEFAGFGRRGRTPFKRTGTLVSELFFKRAGEGARKAGTIGTIRAPASRFANSVVRDKFMDYVKTLWDSRGVGWSITGAAAAQMKKLEGMSKAARDAFLRGRGR